MYLGVLCIVAIFFIDLFTWFSVFDTTSISFTSSSSTSSVLDSWYNSIPLECDKYWVKPGEFPTIEEIFNRGFTDGDDENGGNWTPCTSLRLYKFNYHVIFGQFLALILKPKSVLEFGCGLGQQSDFLSRFVPGGSDVTCIEPEPMFGEVFDRRAAPNKPKQLAINIFKEESLNCVNAMKIWKRDLVVTTEVAEHIPSKYHDQMVDLLARMTGKYLVFSGARPDQKGHGHIKNSMLPKSIWIARFEKYGLTYSERYSYLIAHSAWGQRNYDIKLNVFVMLAPGVTDLREDEFPPEWRILDPQMMINQSYFLSKKFYAEWNNETAAYSRYRAELMESSAHYLWPEMDLIVKKLQSKEMICE